MEDMNVFLMMDFKHCLFLSQWKTWIICSQKGTKNHQIKITRRFFSPCFCKITANRNQFVSQEPVWTFKYWRTTWTEKQRLLCSQVSLACCFGPAVFLQIRCCSMRGRIQCTFRCEKQRKCLICAQKTEQLLLDVSI